MKIELDFRYRLDFIAENKILICTINPIRNHIHFIMLENQKKTNNFLILENLHFIESCLNTLSDRISAGASNDVLLILRTIYNTIHDFKDEIESKGQ